MIESWGTFRPANEFHRRLARRAQDARGGAAQKCARSILLTYAPRGRGRLGPGWARSPSVAVGAWWMSAGNRLTPIAIVTMGELLKFVVNACLPTGRSRQQHYMSELGRWHEFCANIIGSVCT